MPTLCFRGASPDGTVLTARPYPTDRTLCARVLTFVMTTRPVTLSVTLHVTSMLCPVDIARQVIRNSATMATMATVGHASDEMSENRACHGSGSGGGRTEGSGVG